MSALPELHELERLIADHQQHTRVTMAATVGGGYPLYAVELGSGARDAPAVGYFGGVHGNERIGTKVVLAFMHTVLERLAWDEGLGELLTRVRLVFMPLVNPAGMAANRRGNGAGIDLMRNAPVDSRSAHWLVGGQRLSRHLPWYRGGKGELAPENRALVETVRRTLLTAPVSAALDCHSGFGLTNRIWYPYAYTHEPVPHLAEIEALRELFHRTYPNHVNYRIEPQSLSYMTHGDVWDWLYQEALGEPARVFLPFTLEMGSWLWVRKNPLQIFNRLGLFNPLVPHRRQRILRQHLTWCSFLMHAIASYRRWMPNQAERDVRMGQQRDRSVAQSDGDSEGAALN